MLALVANSGRLVADAVNLNPTAAGLPGGITMQSLLNWLAQIVLWVGLGAVAWGGVARVFHIRVGRPGGADHGVELMFAGAGCALAVLLAPAVINALTKLPV